MIFIKSLLIGLFLATISVSLVAVLKDSTEKELSQYQKWKQQFNINYPSAFQDLYREKIFLNKKAIIDLHNQDKTQKYVRGLNQFSALTPEQFRQTYLTYIRQPISSSLVPIIQTIQESVPNANIDWRTQGVVGPIKNQGKCGSCWAFSTVAGLQATSKLFYGQLRSFSEQQLVDCDLQNKGCVGGQMRLAIDYVKKYGSLYEQEYPYKDSRGLCLKRNGHFFVSGHSDVTGCTNLANVLTSRPLVVGLDANTWDDYQSGIFDNCTKDKDVFNHGVLLIGMTSDYWIIKNSFGTKWGENGFMRLAMGDTCNICDDGIMILK